MAYSLESSPTAPAAAPTPADGGVTGRLLRALSVEADVGQSAGPEGIRQPSALAWLLMLTLAALPAAVRVWAPEQLSAFLLAYVVVVEGAALAATSWRLVRSPSATQAVAVGCCLAVWLADTTYNIRVVWQQYPNNWHHLGENCHTLWLSCLAWRQWQRLYAAALARLPRGQLLFLSALALAIGATVFIYVIDPIEARNYRLISRINYWSYTLALIVVMPATISLSMTTLSHIEHIFCQALLLAVVSGLALSYQASMSNFAHASWADVGWVAGVGMMSLLVVWTQLHGTYIHQPHQPVSPFRSYRSILGILAFFANASFVFILRAVGVLDVGNAVILVAVHHSMFLSWFAANLLALSVSQRLFSFTLGLPDLRRVSVDAPSSVPILQPLSTPVRIAEIERLHGTYNRLAAATNQLIQVLLRKNRQAALATLAAQVAHDLGSPAAALNVALDEASLLPESTRQVLRSAVHRIQDITMQLVVSYKGARDTDGGASASARGQQPMLVSSLIATAVAEKRTQYRDHAGVQITSVVAPSAYGIFVHVESNEIIRILSNLINNSVAALGDHGTICLEVVNRPKNVQLLVLDNGRGLSEELTDRLGDERLSTCIDAPAGLGVPHAHQLIGRWGGRLRFTSQPGIGTTAIIELPKVETPGWFLRALDLSDCDTVVVVDDDLSAHGMWRQRLAEARAAGRQVLHLSQASDLRARLGTLEPARAVFLVDYELAGEDTTGLALIAELGIAAQSVLATGLLVVDEGLIRAATRIGVKVVPKNVASALPIILRRHEEPLEEQH